MITEYIKEGKEGPARTLIIMIGISTCIQMLITFVQNMKRSKLIILREMFFVITFTKPLLEAYRVGTGMKQEVDTLLAPLTEMMISKGGELACER